MFCSLQSPQSSDWSDSECGGNYVFGRDQSTSSTGGALVGYITPIPQIACKLLQRSYGLFTVRCASGGSVCRKTCRRILSRSCHVFFALAVWPEESWIHKLQAHDFTRFNLHYIWRGAGFPSISRGRDYMNHPGISWIKRPSFDSLDEELGRHQTDLRPSWASPGLARILWASCFRDLYIYIEFIALCWTILPAYILALWTGCGLNSQCLRELNFKAELDMNMVGLLL